MLKNSNSFRQRFQYYKQTGKLPYKAGRIDDEQMYRERMKDVARENYKQWGYNSPADAWQDAVNDPTYDYRGYYSDPEFQNVNANSQTHWPDRYKTPLHRTFSSESKYHGKQSEKNPYGLRGGQWIGDKFIPAAWQNPIRIPHYAGGRDGEEEAQTNIMAYYPKEDYFTGPSATMSEINVTRKRDGKTYVSLGQQKEPVVKRPYFISSRTGQADFGDIANMAHIVGFGLLPGASDIEDAANVANDIQNKDYMSAGIGAGLLALPNVLEKPAKAAFRLGKRFVISNSDKISDHLAKSRIVKRAINYAMHQTDAANPIPDILRDLNIKKYGDYNPNSISYEDIKRFLQDPNSDRTRLKQVASYILFGRNRDKVIKPHTGITGTNYSTFDTFDTSPTSGFVGPKESVLFGKDMTAGRIETKNDYGVHNDYIMRRPDQTPRRIYNTELPYREKLSSVEDDFITHIIPRTLHSIDDSMPIKTPFGIGEYDAGGHLIEVGRGADKKYYLRGQDIYKFDAIDYAKKHLDSYNDEHSYLDWARQHPFLNLGLMTVQKSVKPIIVRSRWTPVDEVLNSSLTPYNVKKQINEIYDQSTGQSLMFNVPRMSQTFIRP